MPKQQAIAAKTRQQSKKATKAEEPLSNQSEPAKTSEATETPNLKTLVNDPTLEIVSQETNPTCSSKKTSEETTVSDAEEEDESDPEEGTNLPKPIESDIELDQEGDKLFITNWWNGELPTANGTVAKRFTRDGMDEQFSKAEKLITWSDNNTVKVELDPNNWTPFLVAVPGTFRKVRVVYAVSLQHPGTNDEQILALHGEYIPGLSFPNVMVLPSNALEPTELRVPAGPAFSTKRKEKGPTRATWFTTKQTIKRVSLPFIIPIPPVLVYDGFGTDLDAVEVYERWMYMREDASTTFESLDKVLRTFLKAQVVTPTVKHVQGRLKIKYFLEPANESTNLWKRAQIETLEPKITNTVSKASMPSVEEMLSKLVVANHEYLEQRNNSNPRRRSAIDPDHSATKTATLGLAKSAHTRLMGQCGLIPGEDSEVLSLWFALCERDLELPDKENIVRTNMSTNAKYRDAKVKCYSGLINMVIKRKFEEETASSCLKSAVKGLTPFAVPPLTDEEVNRINEQAEAVELATSTTVRDVTSNKISIYIPASLDELTKLLKRFANLLVVCFGVECPLLQQTDILIHDLEGYEGFARTSVTRRTIACIVWTLHEQSRHFAAGKMNPNCDNPLLSIFNTMSKSVEDKLPVQNGSCPPCLYMKPESTESSAGSSKRNRTQGDTNEDRDAKRNKIVKNENYHPLIRERMKPLIIRGQKLPKVNLMCQKSGCRPSDLFPQRNESNLCIKATLFGTCFENCSGSHDLITNTEAIAAMNKLKTVIDNPNLLKVNN